MRGGAVGTVPPRITMWNRILTSPAERVIRGPPRGDNQSWNDGPQTPLDSAQNAAKPPLTWEDLVAGAVGARHVTPTTYRPAAETGTVNAPRDGPPIRAGRS
ncbi:hypothetical protein GCM10010519_51590 [Streptomyces lactacystinicus]